MRHVSKFSLLGALALFATPASATIIGVSPTGGSTGVLIINNACADEADGPALTITGCLNHDHTSSGDVNFSSNENIFFDAGGQAVVKASDGLAQTLTLDPVAFQLGELILNIHSLNVWNKGNKVDGFVEFCDNGGCWGPLFALDGNGENFFDITFDPSADYFTFNTYAASEAGVLGAAAQLIEDSRQWRVTVGDQPPCTGNCGPPPSVPEPGSLLLLGTGLLSLAAIRRRRKQA